MNGQQQNQQRSIQLTTKSTELDFTQDFWRQTPSFKGSTSRERQKASFGPVVRTPFLKTATQHWKLMTCYMDTSFCEIASLLFQKYGKRSKESRKPAQDPQLSQKPAMHQGALS
jgi:hypothetical protein